MNDEQKKNVHWPKWFEHLREQVFEGLPESRRSWWNVEVARALGRIERDITPEMWRGFFHQIQIRILEDVLRLKESWIVEAREQVAEAVELAIAYRREPSKERAETAKLAASSAWWSANNALRSAKSAAECSGIEWEATNSVWRAANTVWRSANSVWWSADSVWWSADIARLSADSAAEAPSADYERIAESVLQVLGGDQ